MIKSGFTNGLYMYSRKPRATIAFAHWVYIPANDNKSLPATGKWFQGLFDYFLGKGNK